MKPHKHPLLFSVLAVVFSLILLLQPVIALEWWQELAAASGLTTAEGYMLGTPISWVIFLGNLIYVHNLNEFVESKSAATGVTGESYAQAIFDKNKNFLEVYRDNLNLLTEANKLMELYFVRRAEYNSLNYLGNETFPEEVMTPVVQDMRSLIVRIRDQLNYFFDELMIDQNHRFPEGYSYVVSNTYPLPYDTNCKDPLQDDISFLYVLDSPTTNETIIWDLESLKPVKIPGVTSLDAEKYLVIAPGHFEIRFYDDNGGSTCELRYVVLYPSGGVGIDYIDLRSLMDVVTDFYDGLRQHYTTAKSYAMTYWSWLRSLGYTSRDQVPDTYTCPPPSALFMDLSNVEGITGKKLIHLYSSWYVRLARELTPSGEVKSCMSIALEGIQSGNLTVTYTYTTESTYTTTTTTVVNATTTTYTTVINGTTTTITTTVGGTTQTGVMTVTTTYTTTTVWTPEDVEIPDVFTRFYNVTICIPNENGTMTCQDVYEMVIIDSLCDFSINVGETATLPCTVTVMVDRDGSGMIDFLTLPAGTQITVGAIKVKTAEGEQELDSYDYLVYKIEELLKKYHYWHEPTTVTVTGIDQGLASLGVLWSTLLVLFPMFIFLIAFLAIPKILSDIVKASRHKRPEVIGR